MQYISEQLKSALASRLKAGSFSRPICRVEVDRLNYIPGYVQEVDFYDYDFIKTIETTTLTETDEVVQTQVKANLPFAGATWGDGTYTLTSGFGMRWGTMHRGADMQSRTQPRDVVSAWDGKVIKVDYQAGGAGHYVKVMHSDGRMTKYMHMVAGSIVVKVGQQVTAGQKLGVEGSTGQVTGRHLHFEVWEGVDGQGNGGNAVDPVPYLNGSKTITGETKVVNSITQEHKSVEYVTRGIPGEVILNEQFKSLAWEQNPVYTFDYSGMLFENVDLYNGYYRPTFTFSETSRGGSPTFLINLNMKKEGYLTVTFSSNMSKDDEFDIFVNSQRLFRTTDFWGKGKAQTTNDIKVPAGPVTIGLVPICRGGMADWDFKSFSFHSIKVREIDTTVTEPVEVTTSEEIPVPSSENEVYKFIENKVGVQLQVGRFAYMDTLVLPNVNKCEVNRGIEQEAAEAKFTLSNPDGYYSPEYNPYYFPDAVHAGQSPYSQKLPGGFHVGVLAENTPVRIYMGYGDLDRPLRVFTGLIDAVTLNGVDGTMEVSARDMYKKIINQVLMRRKQYPETTTVVKRVEEKKEQNVSVNTLDRRSQIYYWAHKQCEAHGIPDDAAYFLLAIARHETGYGTLGQGREPRDMILGYGSYNSNPDYSYGGIEKQFHYGAKRVKEALRTRGYVPKSYDDVHYFLMGGDKGYGTWVWAVTDGGSPSPEWTPLVWKYYKEITANKAAYASPNLSSSTTTAHEVITEESNGTRWMKTAIVSDLLNEAGMYGWRAAEDDFSYPDAIIEESYVIDVQPDRGTVVKALPEDRVTDEVRFEEVRIETIQTPDGYLNPFVEEEGKMFLEFQTTIGEAISDLIKETNYRSYCDRFGTYRLEMLNFQKPIVGTFTNNENLISINKTIDHSRSRSHIVVFDDGYRAKPDTSVEDRVFASFIDKELLLELKGEVRTATVTVPWARSAAAKRQVAEKLFFQMKQLSRTLSVSVPGNPALDILDRIRVVDRNTSTDAVYYIKTIRDSFDVDSGYIQMIDLTWAHIDQIIQINGLTMNTDQPQGM